MSRRAAIRLIQGMSSYKAQLRAGIAILARLSITWPLLALALLSQVAAAQSGIVTRMVVPGGSASTATIPAGGSVTFEVRIDSPTLSPVGTAYRLEQTTPPANGIFSITGRSFTGSPFNDAGFGVPDSTVTAAPGNNLNPENDYNLGTNTVGLTGASPANNILVTTVTLTSSGSTPIGIYRIQPDVASFATEITTDPAGFDWPMSSAFF